MLHILQPGQELTLIPAISLAASLATHLRAKDDI